MKIRHWLLMVLLGGLAGCATTTPLEPRELVYATSSEETFAKPWN